MAAEIVVFDAGKRRLMEILMHGDFQALDGHIRFHLFVNDLVLTAQHTLADLEELVYSGYSPTLLAGVLEQGIDSSDSDTWIWPDVIYDLFTTDQGPTLAFGYYITHTADGALLWGQNFDVPVVWGTLGDTYSFTPQISLGNCCPGLPPPAFSLCAVSSVLRGSAEAEFSIDSVVQTVPFEAFEVDSVLAETRGTDFDFWSFLSGQEQAGFDVDAFLSTERSDTFSIDADLYYVTYPSTFIDSFLIDSQGDFFNVSSVLADEGDEAFTVDSAIGEGSSTSFAVDALLVATPGVLLLYAGSGFVTGPPGIHSWNIWVWGKGGSGYDAGGPDGGHGGYGGGFAMRTSTPVTPGTHYSYVVEPEVGQSLTYLETDHLLIAATHGGLPLHIPGGLFGQGRGGDVNYRGGAGFNGGVGSEGDVGGGGGSAAWMTANGQNGHVAIDPVGGLGGAGASTSGSGGQGGSSLGSTDGQPGVFPGGGGGGGGSGPGMGSGIGGLGGDGFIVVTWQAGVFFWSSVIQGTADEDFTVDSFVARQHGQTFDVDSYLASEGTASFTVDTVLFLPGAETFQIASTLLETTETTFSVSSDVKETFRALSAFNSCIADEVSTDFGIDAVIKDTAAEAFAIDAWLKLSSTKTFTVDSDLKKTQTKTFTISSDLKLSSTKTFTISSVVKKSTTKTFTVDSLIASRPSKTFTMDVDVWNLYLMDTFIGANGNLTSHTMNVGSGWSVSAGTWSIASNQASHTNTGAGAALAQAGSNATGTNTTVFIQALTPATGSFSFGCYGWFDGVNTYYQLYYSGNSSSGTWTLDTVISGTRTTRGTFSAAIPNSSLYGVQLTWDGTSIVFYNGGIARITYTPPAGPTTGQTQFGLYESHDGITSNASLFTLFGVSKPRAGA